MSNELYNIEINRIDGSPTQLGEFEGKTLLIVNVASKCGLTPQYEGLQNLYSKYKDQGLEVLGFPANEFLAQEPGTDDQIQEFCTMNFGVKFPMFSKIVVKGEGQHPLYKKLTEAKPQRIKKPDSKFEEKLRSSGLLGEKESDIAWNFEKFLVNKQGEVVARFAPDILPEDEVIVKAIEAELQ